MSAPATARLGLTPGAPFAPWKVFTVEQRHRALALLRKQPLPHRDPSQPPIVLRPSALRLLSYVFDCTREHTSCFPHRQSIAWALSAAEDSITRDFRDLENAQLVSTQHRGPKGNLYAPLWHPFYDEVFILRPNKRAIPDGQCRALKPTSGVGFTELHSLYENELKQDEQNSSFCKTSRSHPDDENGLPRASRQPTPPGSISKAEIDEAHYQLLLCMKKCGTDRLNRDYFRESEEGKFIVDDTLCMALRRAGPWPKVLQLLAALRGEADYYGWCGQKIGRVKNVDRPAYFVVAAWKEVSGQQWPSRENRTTAAQGHDATDAAKSSRPAPEAVIAKVGQIRDRASPEQPVEAVRDEVASTVVADIGQGTKSSADLGCGTSDAAMGALIRDLVQRRAMR